MSAGQRFLIRSHGSLQESAGLTRIPGDTRVISRFVADSRSRLLSVVPVPFARGDQHDCPVSLVLRQSRTREASASLPQIDETDVPLTCNDSGSASLTCLMISGTIDAPGCHSRHLPMLQYQRVPKVTVSSVASLQFEANRGQTDARVNGLSRERGFSLGPFPQSFQFATIGGFARPLIVTTTWCVFQFMVQRAHA